ncbi:MAG: alpha/beta hydrolase [Rhodospirillaceae bacterium]|nr:alpha/beta hydrolase [Rhodospirillaceae bacterium]
MNRIHFGNPGGNIMHEDISFQSDGLKLAGIFHKPDNLEDGARLPAFVIMHGFGGHKDGPAQRWSSSQFPGWGYACMRFDFRGCGESEGPPGVVVPAEEINDCRAAIDYLATRPEVDPDRIGLLGTSYGAIVATSAAAEDGRAKAVIAQGGWGNSDRFFRELHATPEAWAKFSGMLEEGRAKLAAGEAAARAHRFDIVPIPEPVRANIDERSIFDFSVQTAIATYDFSPQDHVARVAPRPLLIVHAAADVVVRPSGSIDLFTHAGENAELYIMSGVDHFMFGENDPRVINLVKDWLDKYFPAA